MNDATMATEPADSMELSLFPLQTVLFPGGLLTLKVFEARYLDLIGRCMRESKPFGVVCIRQGGEVRRGAKDSSVRFEPLGVLAELQEVDAEQAGILRVRCTGTRRFMLSSARQQDDGLWIADAELLEPDDLVAPPQNLLRSVKALANAIATLREQGALPFVAPYRFEDAGWVANRWCEILPISLAAKQKLMELDDPQVRLQLVDEFLRNKGVVE